MDIGFTEFFGLVYDHIILYGFIEDCSDERVANTLFEECLLYRWGEDNLICCELVMPFILVTFPNDGKSRVCNQGL